MNMVKVKEDLDIANRRALEQIEKKKIEIEREEKRVREQIEIATEKYEITKELAEKRARIDICKRFEEEVAMPDSGDNNPNRAEEHIMKFLDSQPNLTSNEAQTCEVENQVIPIVSVNNQERTTSSQLDPLSPTFTSNVEIRPHTNLQDCNNQPSTAAEDSLGNPNLVQSHLNAMSKLLEMQNRSRLPLPEPGVFSGDPLQYPVWAKAFETLIESHATNSAERLHFLGKYVSGDAKAVVEGFMLLDGDDAYERAKEQLSKRFGNSFAVASAFRKRLDEWPQIAPNDGHGLRKYADLLVQCEKAMDKISSLKVLNDDQENHKMMSKLPRWAATRWGGSVYSWKEEKGDFPPFSEFVKFVVKESDIACDPVNLRRVGKDEDPKRSRYQGYGKQGGKFPVQYNGKSRNTLVTKSEEDNPNNNEKTKVENPTANSCTLCKGDHELDSCQEFYKMDIKERKEFTKSKGLCFGCLKQGHVSKHCKKRKTCRTCGRLHPTSLHGDMRRRRMRKIQNPQEIMTNQRFAPPRRALRRMGITTK